MNTATFNFSGKKALRRGATYKVTFTFKTPQGQPIDLTDATAIAKFKKSLDANTAYSLPVSIVQPPTGGSFVVEVPAEVTANLPTGKYIWDCLITFETGEKWRPVAGELCLVGGVS